MEVIYDVAISFLSDDEPLALRLHDALSENLKVFVYSKKQEQLAGRDGLEVFRQAFFSQSRLLVVLYRDEWGKTKWTAIEELAIKERMFNGGWESLLFVMLDEQSTPPAWLPKTHVRLNYARFGNALVGAIKLRAVELGSKLVTETAIERAKRMQSLALARREREGKLTYQASDAFAAEWQRLCRLLDEKLAQIQKVLSNAGLEYDSGSDGGYVIRTTTGGMDLRCRLGYPASESQVVARAYVGRLILPRESAGRMYVPGDEPDCNSTCEFQIDYNAALRWCWRSRESEESLLTTEALSELLIKQTIDLHEHVESGKITRRKRSYNKPSSPWS